MHLAMPKGRRSPPSVNGHEEVDMATETKFSAVGHPQARTQWGVEGHSNGTQ